MEPTLEKGSLILGTRMYGELETVVVFKHKDGLMVSGLPPVPKKK